MNIISMLFGASTKEVVLNVLLGIVLGVIVPYVNVTLRELSEQGLLKDKFEYRLIIYSIALFIFSMPIVMMQVHSKFLTVFMTAIVVIDFVKRDKVRQEIQPIVRWFAMRKYKKMMCLEKVVEEINNARNKYCLEEWLQYGWTLPNGKLLCSDTNRFRADLAKVLRNCSPDNIVEEWRWDMVKSMVSMGN